MKIAVLALVTMETLVSVGALAQSRMISPMPRQGTSTAAPLNTLTGLMCDMNISAGYENGAASIACPDQKTGQLYNIWVMEGDTPSPAEVIGFIQPFTMGRQSVAGLGDTKMQSFNQRVFLRLNNGKITGMELETSPGK